MNYYVRWDNPSIVLYIICGFIFMLCCYHYKEKKIRNNINKNTILYFMPVLVVWIGIAVFRLVTLEVGGTDAPTYILYFERCLEFNLNYNMDLGFALFTKAIRLVSDDYHVFFLIYYTIIITSIIYFVKEFIGVETSIIPLSISFFLYLRSFTSMRSNFAIAFIMFSIIALKKERYYICFITAIIALLSHTSSLVYVGFIVFYFVNKDKNLRIWQSILILIVMFFAGTLVQALFNNGSLSFLSDVGSGAYASYARRSIGKNIFLNYSVSNIPQLVLFLALILLRKKVDYVISASDKANSKRIAMLRTMSYYDFFVVPVIFVLSIYRGYEYFYIARLLMWGELIPLFNGYFTKGSKKIITFLFLTVFVVWMIGRVEATYQTSHLMPYIFSF